MSKTPRQGRLRFTRAFLLCLIAVVAVCCAILSAGFRRHRHAQSLRADLEARGADVVVYEQTTTYGWAEDVWFVGLKGAQFNDADLATLASSVSVRGIEVEGSSVTDAGISHLARMDRLVDVYLETKTSARALDGLGKLSCLERIVLHDTGADGRTIDALRGLPNLKEIVWHSPQREELLLDGGFPALTEFEFPSSVARLILRDLPKLRRVHVVSSDLEEVELVNLNSLETVTLAPYSEATRPCRCVLQSLPGLRSVRVSSLPLARESFAHWRGLDRLRSLDLTHALAADVTNADLQALGRLPNLKDLRVRHHDDSLSNEDLE